MSDMMPISPEKQAIIDACLEHAEDLLRAAKTVLESESLPHIAFHLAVLSMEEIGKSELVGMSAFQEAKDDELSEKSLDDHVKKLFWAIWGPSFGREVISGEQIKQNQGLATSIHNMRLQGLYVDPNSSALPKDIVDKAAAQTIINMSEARLGMIRAVSHSSFSLEQQELLSWFLKANSNAERRNAIFGQKSMEKLAEVGDVYKWVVWLREVFDTHEKEQLLAIERELQCARQADSEPPKDKWKMTVRLCSASHSIRPKTLNWWNGISDTLRIKLYPAGNKKELLIEFLLDDHVTIHNLWWTGWALSKYFVAAINIATQGFFWWYLPQQTSRYYEKLVDIQRNSPINLDRSPILEIDWGPRALSDDELNRTALCFAMLPKNDAELQKPFDHYLTGLAFLSKNDIHLQTELNAFEQFYRALQIGMSLYGGWDKTLPFSQAFGQLLNDLHMDLTVREKLIELTGQIEADPRTATGVSLTEISFMKIICDYYFMMIFQRMAQERMVDNYETMTSF